MNVNIPLGRIAITTEGCWNWQGACSDNGYGVLGVGGKAARRNEYVHRLMYRLFVGEIPGRMQIDHLCRNRRCCNPAHLSLVTARENLRRGEHPNWVTQREQRCQRGHDLSIEANVKRDRQGHVRCRLCYNLRARLRRATRAETGG